MKGMLVFLIGLMFVVVNVGCASRTVIVADQNLSSSAAAVGGWQFLGKRTAHGKVDRDEIAVTAGKGKFRKLKFEVSGSRLEMHNIVVTFGNGKTFSPSTRLVFRKGGESRAIDLPGGDRVIRKVRFRYGNLPGGGRAHVSLYGR